MANYSKGNILKDLKKNKQDIQNYDKTIELDPKKYFLINCHKINCLRNLSNKSAASTCYNDTIEFEKKHIRKVDQNRTIDLNFKIFKDDQNFNHNYTRIKSQRSDELKLKYSNEYYKKGLFLNDVEIDFWKHPQLIL